VFLLFSASIAFSQAQEPEQALEHGVQVQNMDRAVKPGDDFYEYANGAWQKKTEIPPDRAAVGVFPDLDDLTRKRTAELIEGLAKAGGSRGPSAKKIADLYNSYLNESAIESKGLTPLQPHLKAINDI
jgi:endothelin-converting enzyme/putative endopeptidase